MVDKEEELFIIRVGYGEVQFVLATDSEDALDKVSATKFQEPEVITNESKLKEQLSQPMIERVFA